MYKKNTFVLKKIFGTFENFTEIVLVSKQYNDKNKYKVFIKMSFSEKPKPLMEITISILRWM